MARSKDNNDHQPPPKAAPQHGDNHGGNAPQVAPAAADAVSNSVKEPSQKNSKDEKPAAAEASTTAIDSDSNGKPSPDDCGVPKPKADVPDGDDKPSRADDAAKPKPSAATAAAEPSTTASDGDGKPSPTSGAEWKASADTAKSGDGDTSPGKDDDDGAAAEAEPKAPADKRPQDGKDDAPKPGAAESTPTEASPPTAPKGTGEGKPDPSRDAAAAAADDNSSSSGVTVPSEDERDNAAPGEEPPSSSALPKDRISRGVDKDKDEDSTPPEPAAAADSANTKDEATQQEEEEAKNKKSIRHQNADETPDRRLTKQHSQDNSTSEQLRKSHRKIKPPNKFVARPSKQGIGVEEGDTIFLGERPASFGGVVATDAAKAESKFLGGDDDDDDDDDSSPRVDGSSTARRIDATKDEKSGAVASSEGGVAEENNMVEGKIANGTAKKNMNEEGGGIGGPVAEKGSVIEDGGNTDDNATPVDNNEEQQSRPPPPPPIIASPRGKSFQRLSSSCSSLGNESTGQHSKDKETEDADAGDGGDDDGDKEMEDAAGANDKQQLGGEISSVTNAATSKKTNVKVFSRGKETKTKQDTSDEPPTPPPKERFRPKRPRRQSQSSQQSKSSPPPKKQQKVQAEKKKKPQQKLQQSSTATTTLLLSPTMIITGEQYHQRFCLPHKRKLLAKNMHMVLMNQGIGMQHPSLKGQIEEGKQRPFVAPPGIMTTTPGGRKSSMTSADGSGDYGTKEEETTNQITTTAGRKNSQGSRGSKGSRSSSSRRSSSQISKDQPTPNSQSSRRQRVAAAPNSNNSGGGGSSNSSRQQRMENSKGGDQGGGGNGLPTGFPTMPFQDAAQSEPLSGGSNPQQQPQRHQMVMTGVPLRDSGISGRSDSGADLLSAAGMGTSGASLAERRRSSSNNWDTLSLGGFSLGDAISPAPFKDVATAENFFSKFPGMSPMVGNKEVMDARNNGLMMMHGMMMGGNGGRGGGLDRRGSNTTGGDAPTDLRNAELRERMGMFNNNLELRERMMMNMMGMGAGGGSGGSGSLAGGGMGMVSQLNTPVMSMRPMLGDADHGGQGSSSAVGTKRKFSTDIHSLSGGIGSMGAYRGGGGGQQLGGFPSPTPKKSFLQRERVMDAEMRNHMKEALAGFKKHHNNRSQPDSGSTGQSNRRRLSSQLRSGSDLDNPPSHPNSNMGTPHEMTPQESSMMMAHPNSAAGQQQAAMLENMRRVNLPSLTSPDEGIMSQQHHGSTLPGMTITQAINTVNQAFNNPDNDAKNESEPLASYASSKKNSKSSSSKSAKGNKASKKMKKKDIEKNNKANKSSKSKKQEELTASILAAAKMPDKPKRPFSAYNLFFQLEREYIMHEISEGRKPLEDPMIMDAMQRADKDKDKKGGDKVGDKKGGDKDATSGGNKGVKKEGGGQNNFIGGGRVESVSVSIIADENIEKEGGDATSTSSAAAVGSSPPKSPQLNLDPASKFFNDPNIPSRYVQLSLDKFWYSVGHKQKRKHRKTQGSCGFIELTKMVSARWKLIDETDPHVKRYCQKLADLELDSYKSEMDVYKKEVKKAENEAKTKAMMMEAGANNDNNAVPGGGMEAAGSRMIWEMDNRDVDAVGQRKTTTKMLLAPSVKKSSLKRQKSQQQEGATTDTGGKKKKKSKKDRAKAVAAGTAALATAKNEEEQQQHRPLSSSYTTLTPEEHQKLPHPALYNDAAAAAGRRGSVGDMMLGQMRGGPGGVDMARFTDLTRMSGMFAGGVNTPRGESFLAGLCGDASTHSRAGAASGADDSRGQFSGLPPPPFSDGADGHNFNSRHDARSMAAAEARMAAAAAMDASQMNEARMAAAAMDASRSASSVAEAQTMNEARIAAAMEARMGGRARMAAELAEARMGDRARMAAELAEARMAGRGGGTSGVGMGTAGMMSDEARMEEAARMAGARSMVEGLMEDQARQHQAGGGGGSGHGMSEDVARMDAARSMVERRAIEARLMEEQARSRGGGGAVGISSRLSEEDARMIEARKAEARKAAESRMAEARIAEAQQAQQRGGDSDIQQKFAKLAEAEARHRMQMEIQGGMLGRNNMGDGGSQQDRRGGPQQQHDRHGFGNNMGRVPQDSIRGGDHSISPYNRQTDVMSQGNFPGVADNLPSPLRRRFMEQYGATMPPNVPRHATPGGAGAANAGGGGEEQQFDMEVERFLSCLGEEIKENRRRQQLTGGGGAAASAGGAPGMAGFGAESMAGMGGGMAEMAARMGAMGAGGGGGGGVGQEQMMMGSGTPMSMRAEMMAQMMMRNGGAGAGGGSNSSGRNNNHPSPEMMAEMMMMRRAAAAGGGNANAMGMMMPRPPFDGNDFRQHQAQQQGGGGGDDDNPALPEYGWGRNGPN